jgi:hypothetical protein
MAPQGSFTLLPFTETEWRRIWLSPQVFEWELEVVVSRSVEERSALRRSYQGWAHADRLIQAHDDEHYLSDAIVGLHRVVDRRVRRLNELYRFRKIPIQGKPKELWELMNYVGIIRPRMFAHLKQVRRLIEHHDGSPPLQDRCAALSEFVWYFLQSTDGLITEVIQYFNLEDDSKPWPPQFQAALARIGTPSDMAFYALQIEGGPDQEWRFTINGTVPRGFISTSETREWLEVEDAQTCEWLEVEDASEYIGICGTITGPSEPLRRLVEAYFQARP